MFDPRELAAVLAGLRLIQCHANDGYTEEPIADVATNGGTLTPLDDGEIDDLCERLNTASGEDQLVDLLALLEPDEIRRAFAKAAPSGCFKLDLSDDALDAISDDDTRHRARKIYASDDIEIDGDAAVSAGDDGDWVQAWVRVAR